jgi:cysteinyl-tRNA synthetase
MTVSPYSNYHVLDLNARGTMDDDLDTPTALTVLGTLASRIQAAATANRDISEAQDTLRAFATIFGLRLAQADVEPRVSAGWNTHLQRFV